MAIETLALLHASTMNIIRVIGLGSEIGDYADSILFYSWPSLFLEVDELSNFGNDNVN